MEVTVKVTITPDGVQLEYKDNQGVQHIESAPGNFGGDSEVILNNNTNTSTWDLSLKTGDGGNASVEVNRNEILFKNNGEFAGKVTLNDSSITLENKDGNVEVVNDPYQVFARDGKVEARISPDATQAIKDFFGSGATPPPQTGDEFLIDAEQLVSPDPRPHSGTFGSFLDWLDPFFESQTQWSPIVLDLDGDGIETKAIDSGAFFDHDANGFAESSGWVAGDDGLLVRDLNGNGRIDSGRELFGNETLLPDGQKASNGFVALQALDENSDGKLDSQDSAWASLQVWRDLDGDGFSVPSEIFSLADVGIQSIDVAYSDSTHVDANGNAHKELGSFTRTDGTTSAAADVWFQTNKALSLAEQTLAVPADIDALPDAQGLGNVYNLRQAMVRDSSGALKGLVQSFVNAEELERNSLLEQILLKWTGTEAIDPASRGGKIDARHLAALEMFAGQPWIGIAGDSNPNDIPAITLSGAYANLSESVYAQLMARTSLKSIFDSITYTFDSQAQALRGDLSAVKATLTNSLAANLNTASLEAYQFIRAVKGLGASQIFNLDALRSDAKLSWLLDNYRNAKFGSATSDILTAGSVNTFVWGGAGNDTLYGSSGTDLIDGGAGNDTLDGGAGVDTLLGGAGDDVLGGSIITWDYGNQVNGVWQGNIYEGGLGNDVLRGTAGGDIYRFNVGDGQDVIQENGSVPADRLIFGAGIAPSDVQAARSDTDMVFTIGTGGDRITVQGWYSNVGPYTQVERIEFSDGTVWLADAFTAAGLAAHGTAGADVLTGVNSYGNQLYGEDGDDTLNGGNAADSLYGGMGNDTLHGNDGDDLVDGGEGNDTLYGEAGSDLIDGGAGDDVLDGGAGVDTLLGGAGDDILGGAINTWDYGNQVNGVWQGNVYEGGLGNDVLRGTAGSDIYRFNAGDGEDVIQENGSGTPYVDRLVFGAGIAPSGVQASRSGTDMVFNIGTTGDRITVQGWYAAPGPYTKLEQLEFSDGTVVLGPNIYIGDGSANTLDGSVSADFINGGAGSDTINGGAGSDVLNGDAGDDTISAGTGNDVIRGGDGFDTVYGDDGDDFIFGDAGNDNMSGDTGNDYLSGGAQNDNADGGEGNDVVQGQSGDDQVQGGVGNDLLTGDAGADALDGSTGNDFLAGGTDDDIVGTGDGHNIIAYNLGGGTDTVNSAAGASNTLSFGGGLRYGDLSLSKDGNDLLVNAGSAGDKVVLKDWYAGKNNVLDLQLILDATNQFDAGSSDPLYNGKVQNFDFLGLVGQFDQALAESPGLSSWAITNSLLQFHLSGSDDSAIGGDLAYWYGKNGALTGVGLTSAQQVIGEAAFGSEVQALRPFSGLQEGLLKLS